MNYLVRKGPWARGEMVLDAGVQCTWLRVASPLAWISSPVHVGAGPAVPGAGGRSPVGAGEVARGRHSAHAGEAERPAALLSMADAPVNFLYSPPDNFLRKRCLLDK